MILTSLVQNAQKLSALTHEILRCNKCPRLRQHCQDIAQTKRKAFLNEAYWGKPVASFGDPKARLFIVGLAPAAHGANRTGRMFTGDQSGLWLYRALHRAGFANQAESTHAKDGLRLLDAIVTAVARCAPPDNKPTPEEIATCLPYLGAEIKMFPQVKVFVALGQIALNGLWKILSTQHALIEKKPKFAHGAHLYLSQLDAHLLCSYHPSQQNTFTGRLTEVKFDSIFKKARELIL